MCSCALWILGEYSTTVEEIEATVDTIKQSVGPLPLLAKEGDEAEAAGTAAAGSAPATAPTGSRRPAVLADGTYASQAAVVELPSSSAVNAPSAPNLRSLLLGGDFFIGGAMAGALTKLALRRRSSGALSAAAVNKATAEAMLYIVSVLRLGEWPELPTPLDDDSRLRMMQCLQVLAKPEEELVHVRALIAFVFLFAARSEDADSACPLCPTLFFFLRSGCATAMTPTRC